MPDSLKDLRKQVAGKREKLRTVFEQTKNDAGEYDFQKADAEWLGEEIRSLEGTQKSVRVAEEVRKLNDELDDDQRKLESLEAAARAGDELSKRDKEPANRPGSPSRKDERAKSFGERITEHPIYKEWQAGRSDGQIVLEDVGLKELKTLFSTSAGWAPESTRTGVVVPDVTRPLQILDVIPTGRTGMANVVYMEETTRTHAAAETSEGQQYPESEFALTEQSSAVRKIADSVPVTDEQLEDVAMVQSYLEGRLNFGVQQRLDGQIVSGDGVAPNLEGIINKSGIQTQAKGSDPTPDAVYKAMTKVRVTGRAIPTHVAMHPNDWQQIRLLRTADGVYIWGSPSESGAERLWGLPVVQNESLTEGTGLVGSFMPSWILLAERRGIVIERGFVNTQFIEGEQTIRASMRAALVIYRPAAFATVTSI